MDRRNFVKLGLFVGAGSTINTPVLAAETVASTVANSTGDAKKSSSIIEADVTELQTQMQSGKLTAVTLTKHYLERIKAIDKSGP